MAVLDVNSLFARAEQSFAAGRLDAARRDLQTVQRLAGDHPAVLHLLALVEKKRGDLSAARVAFEQALRLAPADPQINNNHANLLNALGDAEAALTYYGRALAANARFADARYNRALLLQRMGRLAEALEELDALLTGGSANAKLHSARASILRDLGRLEDAANSYDAALRLEPSRFVALHGRARVAVERGEPNAAHLYRNALSLKPDDPTLQLGLAEALEADGDPRARQVLAATVAKRPNWTEGQVALARMRWEAGEGAEFARSFEQALREAKNDRGLWFAYSSALFAADLFSEAADAAGRGRMAVGEDDGLALLEAFSASRAGDLERADKLFAQLPPDLPGASIYQAQHLARRRNYKGALCAAERMRAEDPWNVSAWAMTGLLWRVLDDARAEWLHGQPGFFATRQLALSDAEIEAIADRLRNLHRTRAHPIGQSLRGGTQTRGRLFERGEPEVRLLGKAIRVAVEDYWDGLPAADAAHPLLRHRNARPRLSGSWSVRLTDGGFHVAHIHPQGIVSSACYLIVPIDAGAQAGWLEIGRSPPDLGLSIEPLFAVEPKPGELALFPSTLYHGTRSFPRGERLTAAFDVIAG